MPYAYSASAARSLDPTPARPSADEARRRRRLARLGLAAAVVTAGGTAGGILASLGGPGSVDSSSAGRAVERALLEANVLEENLGAPPAGAAASVPEQAAFALRSDPRRGGALAVAGRAWTVGGRPSPLSRAVGQSVLAGQRDDLERVFAGPLLRRELAELASLVAAEERQPPSPDAPGGAKVLQWYSVSVGGQTARAEAIVERWEQHVAISGSGSGAGASSVSSGAIDALASLRLIGGRWRVVSLAEAPWQEPT